MEATPLQTGAIPQNDLSIGELAHRSQVTVRTLHHYDEVGLLKPAYRTPSGHRRYGVIEAERLRRIVALRSLGFSLDDIEAVIDTDAATTVEVAERQREQLRSSIARLQEIEQRLTDLIDQPADEIPSFDKTLELTAMTIRINRVTTRGGDLGETSLADGSRVPKTDARIEAIGAVDELNAIVGVARHVTSDGDVDAVLGEVQHQLFDLGADLATPTSDEHGRLVDEATVRSLEHVVEQFNESLPALNSFILPGGPNGSSQLHIARTVCRRVERRVLDIDGDIGEAARYLNRLSDVFFVLGRAAAQGNEHLWEPRTRTS